MAKKKKNKNKITTIGTILSIIAVVLVIGAFLFIFRPGGTSHDIEININTNEIVKQGVPLEVRVDINNRTSEPLRDTELVVTLSDGLVNLNYEGDRSIERISLNNLGEDTLTKQTIRVLPISDIENEEEIKATLTYTIGNASFEKEATHNVKISEKPVEVGVLKPDQILEGSSFDATVFYKNNSDFDFPKLHLTVTYPDSFNFGSASLEPTSLNNQWDLGALKANSEGEIDIRGTIQNGGQTPTMTVVLSAEFINTTYEIARQQVDIQPSESPLSLNATLSGDPAPGNKLTYTVSYENKSGVALRDALVQVELAGGMFNLNSIETDGDINALKNQIVWDKSLYDQLDVLEPGESGVVSFSVNLKDDYNIRRLSDKNFEVVVNANIESPTVPYYLQADKTMSSDQIRTKVLGKTTVDAQAFYRDASSGFLNEGSLPPSVGDTTQFTIHWEIENYATDVEDVVVTANLPENVEWAGQVKSNLDTVPLYDEGKRSITWEIDEISATKGVISSPIEAVFQVSITPTESYRGTYHPILSSTELEAYDTFTEKNISFSDGQLNTSLPDDSSTNESSGIVQ